MKKQQEMLKCMNQEERRSWAAGRAEQERIELALVPLEEFCEVVETLARASLLAAGYHRHHRGEWRRKRGT